MGVIFFSSRSVGLAVCCLGAALVLPSCSQPAATQNRRGSPAVAVKTTPVQKMTVQRQVDLAGTLLSPDQARVSAEAAGIVRGVLVEIGREVRVGDPLVRLDEQEL